jgi:uncharacterized protein YjiS (DUF1127 family)
MVTLILAKEGFAAPRPNPVEAIRGRWRDWQRRRAERFALARAGRLGPRLLADMGLAVEADRPVVGGWDDLPFNGCLVARRR